MAENTLIVEAVSTWSATYNYSIITNPDTGMSSLQERVRRADAYQNGTMTALKFEQCLKDPAKFRDLLCAEELRASLNHALYKADYLNTQNSLIQRIKPNIQMIHLHSWQLFTITHLVTALP
ncbi:hypothetical protein [Enterobacter asburiae]